MTEATPNGWTAPTPFGAPEQNGLASAMPNLSDSSDWSEYGEPKMILYAISDADKQDDED